MGAVQALPFFRKSTKHLATSVSVPSNVSGSVDSLKEYLDKELGKSGIPGLSLSFVAQSENNDTNKKEWHEWHYNFGYSDINEMNATNPSTIYHLYGGTNIFTAMAIMQLVDSNDIKSLNDAICQYLPEKYLNESKLAKIVSSNCNEKQLTLASLLTHSSYLKDDVKGFMQIHFPNDDTVTATDALYNFGKLRQKSKLTQLWHRYKNPFKWTFFDYTDDSQAQTILMKSKSTFANINYALLGAIIENVSKVSYQEYITQNIFNPLHINAFFRFNDIYESKNDKKNEKNEKNDNNDDKGESNINSSIKKKKFPEISEKGNEIGLWENIARPYIGGWDTLRWHIWRKLDKKTREKLDCDYISSLNVIELSDFELDTASVGGILISCQELLKFIKFQIDCKDDQFKNVSVLAPLSLQRMQTLQKNGRIGTESKYGVGLGWKIGLIGQNENEKRIFINHEGTGIGATTEMRIYPNYNCGIVICCNYTGIKNIPKIMHKLCEIVFLSRNTICGCQIPAKNETD